MSDYSHFSLMRDDNDVAWLKIDVAGKSVNVMASDVMAELSVITRGLADNPPSGLVLYSGKERGFIFGADINEFADFPDRAAVETHIFGVLESFQRIEDLPCMTVILIDGICLGGGYEMALAFDRIIGVDHPSCQVGLPEINLGLLPGYGGSGRSFARMGLEGALKLVLHGRPVRAADAVAMGAIDHVVASKDDLKDAAERAIAGDIGRKPPQTCENPDELIARERAAIATRTRPENTPAPFAILDHYSSNNLNKTNIIERETKLFSELMMTPASAGLRRVFQLNDLVKKGGRGDPAVSHIHVIGAGVMGGDIAAVAAMSGFKVTLQDMNQDAINTALARAETLYQRRLKTPEKVAATMSRLTGDPDGAGLAEADLLIEAVAEVPEVKKAVFAAAEKQMKPSAIMATNTSAIPLEDIAAALNDPSRLIGMHFFNPVPVLPLVEIIYTDASNPEFIARAMYVGGAMKKQPIRCKSSPGFLVNRALLPYVFKAIDAVIDGANADLLDQAMVRFGMPMGPVELADQVGLDVCHDAGVVLGISDTSRSKLRAMMEAGTIGRKSGSGFYEWDDKKAVRPRADYDGAEMDKIAHDLLAPLIAECRAAVDEGVVDSADMADAACIFGIGFPAHTGGPLFWYEGVGQGV